MNEAMAHPLQILGVDDPSLSWTRRLLQTPAILKLGAGDIIFFSSRDAENQSIVGYAYFPKSSTPVITSGPLVSAPLLSKHHFPDQCKGVLNGSAHLIGHHEIELFVSGFHLRGGLLTSRLYRVRFSIESPLVLTIQQVCAVDQINRALDAEWAFDYLSTPCWDPNCARMWMTVGQASEGFPRKYGVVSVQMSSPDLADGQVTNVACDLLDRYEFSTKPSVLCDNTSKVDRILFSYREKAGPYKVARVTHSPGEGSLSAAQSIALHDAEIGCDQMQAYPEWGHLLGRDGILFSGNSFGGGGIWHAQFSEHSD